MDINRAKRIILPRHDASALCLRPTPISAPSSPTMRWLQRIAVLAFWFELICGMLAGQIVLAPCEAMHEQPALERDAGTQLVQPNAKEKVLEATQEPALEPYDPPEQPAGYSLSLIDLLEPPRLATLSVPQPRGPPAHGLAHICLTPIVPRGPPSLGA